MENSTRASTTTRMSSLLRLSICLLSGCGTADLPAGWSDAVSVSGFAQSACEGGPAPVQPPTPSVSAGGFAGAITLDYRHALLRCEQALEGFVRHRGRNIDVLVQPIDMNPSAPARCSCLYRIQASVFADGGPHTVTVYKRFDNVGGAHEPSVQASVNVIVPGESASR